jgi:hypothetical protein
MTVLLVFHHFLCCIPVVLLSIAFPKKNQQNHKEFIAEGMTDVFCFLKEKNAL